MKNVLLSMTLLLVLACALPAVRSSASERHPASPGTIDLTGWDAGRDGTLELKGEWEMYWSRLLAPEQLRSVAPSEALHVPVPGQWGEYRPNGEPLPNEGYATYRLTVLLPDDVGRETLALYVRSVATAYRLWVNGEPLAANGVVGTAREEMVPANYPKTVSFVPRPGPNEIVVQVSNFVQRKGGLWEAIRLGESGQIARERGMRIGSEMFIVGAMLVMGLYHVGLYAFRRQERSPLYFGVMCLALAARTLVLGETLVPYWFPSVPWELAVKAEYASVCVGFTALVLFIRNEYVRKPRNGVLTAYLAVQASVVALVLTTPARVYTLIMLPYQLAVVVPVLAYTMYVYVRAWIRKQEGSAVNMAGFVGFGASVAGDILFYNRIVAVGTIIPYGILLFLFTQSVRLSLTFARTSRRAEALSVQLQAANDTLERKIAERTAELRRTNGELERANDELSRMQTVRRRLLSDISHELGTPITSIKGYSAAMMEGVITDDYGKYARRIYERTALMERLIDDLTELTKLETGQIAFDYKEVEAASFFRLLYRKYEPELPGDSYDYGWEETAVGPGEADSAIVKLDPIRIEQVVSNMMSNACKYTPAGGRIRMRLELRWGGPGQGAGEAVVSVIDSGPGIPEREAELIFDRFYRVQRTGAASAAGNGLGLAICKEIVGRHGGRIGVDSKPGEGSRFYFALPIRESAVPMAAPYGRKEA
ncbi:ATP-binding protein [Paenibacillus flagellatus]|uniref:histidine kinase n=1 Tax=Paenibacillus flagellatus TaxID=2211139 RepID=A0A2V5K0R5_9BACL|nr:ATP-binding protein [Paenibacillus flagellatus]PYI51053.1 histidine kinase [Paenibacillus flagellatus]